MPLGLLLGPELGLRGSLMGVFLPFVLMRLSFECIEGKRHEFGKRTFRRDSLFFSEKPAVTV
jgi:hypothetical protein